MSQTSQSIIILIVSSLLTYLSADEETNLLTKLNCQAGEKRVFDYESTTQLWGPLNEDFLVKADVIVHCLGSDENGKYGTNGLKYMVQIENLKPSVIKIKQNEIKRNKRSVGGWFKQAWVDVKDFFVNLFTRKNRKSDKESDSDFDFEKQPSNLQYQCKNNKNRNRFRRSTPNYNINYDKMFAIPYVFIQLLDGSVPEIRFSDKETDPSIKNFKRHIADTFATQLDASKNRILEKSPIGSHFSEYSYDDSGKIEESLQQSSDGTNLKLSSSFLALSQTKEIKQLAVMRDVSPDDVMSIGDGKGMIPDNSQIGVNAKQIQKITEGRLTTTAGHLSLSLVSPMKSSSRTRRDTNTKPEIEDYLKVRTKYSLSMTKRITKRSTDEKESLETLKQMESKLNLKGEQIISESTAENSLKDQLISSRNYINEKLNQNTKNNELFIRISSDYQNPLYNTLIKSLNLEVILNEDKTVSSMTRLVNNMIKEKTILDICGTKLSLKNKQCFDLLLILVKSQSSVAQSLLLKQIKSDNSIEDKIDYIKLIVQTPNPQNLLINQLLDIMKGQTNSNFEGIILLAVSNLGYHSKSLEMKNKISDILKYKLNQMNCDKDSNNPLLEDVLEAIGNLGSNTTVLYSEMFGETCHQSESIRIAAIHSCRRLLTHPGVQKWYLRLLKEPKNSCVIKQEVVNAIIEDINAIEMDVKSANRWPKIGFNEIDNVLSDNLINEKHNECLENNIIRYFERKHSEISKNFLKKIKRIRSKREVYDSFWTESSCKEWVPPKDDNNKQSTVNTDESVIISDRMRESEDTEQNVSYIKRRKCSATKRFGPNQAQAVFKANIVNDATGSLNNPDYKLMAQFVAGTHFLGSDIDIGKMYVYHKKDSSRAYVNIFGNTLVDAATSDCNASKVQPYISSNFIPVYDFNLWIVQMSLGIRLNVQMDFDLPQFNCQSKTANQLKTINFKPEAQVKAAGEVISKVLVMKGGMNIGGDFNYHSNLDFEPSHQLCLTVSNGYNPMNVSLNSWYQFWSPVCTEWTDKILWTPLTFNWQINDKHRSTWIENECLISDNMTPMKKRIEP
ncbi:uncharacterized protein LOC128952980 [Oppia nitens]|uniref:uncharacterized protein LOC128952980 n=1 Tax=Oppia nitens TaxID=1686743 RepID=UPI0023DC5F06|nr:uncharacterized protein LOC128952980 [Oppia nitens]XP_054154437.1 uncharacterized protein LOC128952980 [Oppia nitens]